jgi:CheY-like chemotaxis protein
MPKRLSALTWVRTPALILLFLNPAYGIFLTKQFYMSQGKHYTILMVEDDDDDRHITQAFFTEKGYDIDVQFLDNSDRIIPYLEDAAMEGTLPNLILLDLNLPRKNGFEVLKELKTHPQFHLIPVVIVSGTSYPHEVNECYRLGANSFVQKPFTDDLTQKKIETFVDYWFNVTELPLIQPQPNITL